MDEIEAIAAFLAARLDEDQERAAKMRHYFVDEPYFDCPATRTAPLGDLPWGEDACDCGLAEREARALREVEAKRALIRLADDAYYEADHYAYHGIRQIVAAIYSDHPDYRAAWKP